VFARTEGEQSKCIIVVGQSSHLFLLLQVVPTSAPTIHDLYSPTFSAIITGGTMSDGFQRDGLEDESDMSRTETVVRTSSTVVDSLPAFVIGFASSIVLCAGYIVFSETRDRWKNQGSNANEGNSVITGKKCHRHYNMTSRDGQSIMAASIVSRSRSVLLLPVDADMVSSTNSVHYYEKGPDGLVYPVILVSNVCHPRAIVRKTTEKDHPDHSQFEERSLSPVSTITSSVALDSTNSNRGTMELTEFHRVSRDTTLQSLVNLGNVSASPASSSSRSQSTFSLPKKKNSDAQEIFKKVRQEQVQLPSSLEKGLQKISISDFDGVMAEPSSVMVGSCMDGVLSISEEDESGWTSCGGKSDSSSEVSIGTYLKSICSARSRSSAFTITTNKSSILLGESLATSPKNISNQESREDENSMEFSLEDDSLSLTEPRTDNDDDVTILLNDILGSDSSSSRFLNENVGGGQIKDRVNGIEIGEGLSNEVEEGVTPRGLEPFAESIDIVTSIPCKELIDREGHNNGSIQATPTESGNTSTQLGQFLERNNIVGSESNKEVSTTNKLSSFPDGSLLSTTTRSSSCTSCVNLCVDRGEDSAESGPPVGDEATDPASNPTVSAV
jgi:hypothetical protein